MANLSSLWFCLVFVCLLARAHGSSRPLTKDDDREFSPVDDNLEDPIPVASYPRARSSLSEAQATIQSTSRVTETAQTVTPRHSEVPNLIGKAHIAPFVPFADVLVMIHP
ncbi:uncharacterized protein AB675_9485 [Cyphellophora attinorum]|uniref:Uncharacterized protein n=1 Tax=Cyphellophora attinorum TaxID=1664694 RepID=A0A0N0NPG0_9EURO|nr:uncharacterized protein AB675_9485 [Phialophora attinorum]KPI42499.1 hypothetical protein AB675_9485 [Phialophora attinorum]